VNLAQSLSDFIELYLSIDLSRKDLDLIKLHALVPIQNNDELEQTVRSFRNAISAASKHHSKVRSKSHYSLPEKMESLLHLKPEDFLIVLAQTRYAIDMDTLSIILKTPPETISFKLSHLKRTLNLNEQEIKTLHTRLQPLEKKRFSQLQKIKNRSSPKKFIIESIVVMSAVLFVLWTIPKIRGKYEKWAEKKTSEFFVSDEIKDAPISPELNTKPIIIENEVTSSEDSPQLQKPKSERRQPKVFAGEVWRFSFTGSGKTELEKELKEILQKYSSQPPKGSIAPGGIQYDAFVKVNDLISLKMAFENMADNQPQTLKMSWYKKKNMGTKKIPDAHVEVVIWISTI
jgi:hypothetical protein